MLAFWHEASPAARKALLAASMGWLLDAFDVMLYALILTAVVKDLGLTLAVGGQLASLTLAASAVGGLVFGVLADKLGRTRALSLSILIYSVFTFACGLAQNVWQLAAVPDPARPGHGRRVGQRRGARAAKRGPRSIAARRSASCRAAGRSATARPPIVVAHRAAAIRLARGVLRRHPARALHVVDPPQRQGAGVVDEPATQPAEQRVDAAATRESKEPGAVAIPWTVVVFLTLMNAATMFA